MASHAALPTVLHLEGDRYRVYFAARDRENRSHVGWFDLELSAPYTIEEVSEEPVLEPGPLGHFDDHGVYAASVVRDGTVVRMYTIGWNVGTPRPLFYASIGLATSRDGGRTFCKHGRAPIMARSDHDPCFVSAPFVLREGTRWRMWYLSGTGWDFDAGVLKSTYHVKYAESDDGLAWRRSGVVALGPCDPSERNIARACILRHASVYHAWFSSDRGDGYRIRFARSHDGIHWTRDDDDMMVPPSGEGWDSEATAYPYVVHHRGRRFMFYNGNGFGRDGVGLAVER